VGWEDWVAASRLGARHLRERIGPSLPFIMAGYSNGGALSVKYALDALTKPDLLLPDRLFLFSPEIGIEPLARIANSHELLETINSHLERMEKLLVSYCGQHDAGPKKATAEEQNAWKSGAITTEREK